MPSIPRDPDALKRALATALRLSPGDCESEGASGSYEYLLRRCWERMEMVVGRLGAQAIVEHAIKRTAPGSPSVVLVRIDEGGLDLAALKAAHAGRDVCLCLLELSAATLLTLAELTGDVVAGPLLDEIAREQ